MASASASKKEIMRITASSRNARIIDEARNLRKTRREGPLLHWLNGYSAEGRSRLPCQPRLLIYSGGMSAADRPLANPVRSGRKQPQRVPAWVVCSVSHPILSRHGRNDGSRDRLS